MGITAIDRFVVQLERQLWRDGSDYLDVDGYAGILRACAFSRESTVSLIRNELLGVSSTPENEGDSAIITSFLHIIRKEYPSQWEATYSLIREIIWSNSIDRPVQEGGKEEDPVESTMSTARCLDSVLLQQTLSQAIRYTKFLADTLKPEEERLHYQMMQTVQLKRSRDS